MSAREIFKACYRIMRVRDNPILFVNGYWLNYHQMYLAASECYIMEASHFQGWVNRERKYRWLERRLRLSDPFA